ncbi:hypothetical protein BY996DRAFT_6432375 [Phakopsora pachyrhizi]|nr:hypothetical protein BY996DRAFT_6432375 [Phakopsora pachyrhizi]
MATSSARTSWRCLIDCSYQLRSRCHKRYSQPAQRRELIAKKRTGGHSQTSLLKQALKKGSTSTGGTLQDAGQVVAYSTAEEYNVRALHRRLTQAGYNGPIFNVLGEAIWIPDWHPVQSKVSQTSNSKSSPMIRKSEVFIFESGSFVSWGVSPEEASKFLDTIVRPHTPNTNEQLELNPCRNPEKETMDYIKSNSGPMLEIGADQIVIGPTGGDIGNPPVTPTRKLLTHFMNPDSKRQTKVQDPPSDPLILSKLAVSSALAKACKLSRYEAQLDEFLSKVEHVPEMLKSGNDSPLDKKEIVARYGELLDLRQGLSLKEENLLDLPEWFWEDTGAEERHFKKILREFDFERRFRNLNDKLSMAIELQARLFEFSNSKYSHRLEWIIILLIAFEVAHAIYVADHHRK